MRTIYLTLLAAAMIPTLVAGCKKELKEPGAISLKAVVGEVTVNGPGNGARVGMALRPGDLVITGNNSMAILQVPDRSGIKVYENTAFRVLSIETDGRGAATDARFDLGGGKAFLAIEKLAKSRTITVSSPTAVASVRGTSFMVEVRGADGGRKEAATGVSVVSGTVEVTARNAPAETRSVTDGTRVVMAGERVAEDTRPIAAGDLKELRSEEKEIATSLEGTGGDRAEEPGKEKPAPGAPPVLKSEQAIREYYNKLEEVNLDDGSTLIGAVIYQDTRVARIHTTAGVVQVPTGSIVTIRIR